jgi:hypothetical protein
VNNKREDAEHSFAQQQQKKAAKSRSRCYECKNFGTIEGMPRLRQKRTQSNRGQIMDPWAVMQNDSCGWQ